jgi:hypothetical protein
MAVGVALAFALPVALPVAYYLLPITCFDFLCVPLRP